MKMDPVIKTIPDLLGEDFLKLGILITIGLCLGLVINQFRDKPMPWIYQSKQQRLDHAVAGLETKTVMPPEPKKATGTPAHESVPESLTLEQFQACVTGKVVLILDARPELFHRIGHVPGSIALPRDEFETYYKKHQAELEKDKAQPLVIYCSGGSCEDSGLVSETLKKLGYTNVGIFRGGWDEWTHAGLPEEK
jgi:rhodanese-related sulfurtransferase